MGGQVVTASAHGVGVLLEQAQHLTRWIGPVGVDDRWEPARPPTGAQVVELGPVNESIHKIDENINIKELEVKLEGDLDLAGFFGLSDEVPAGFSGIRAKVHLDADASDEQIQALHEHVLKTSPVGCILSKPLPIETELE